jgi:4-hydroxy-tetrahydrodipicolinate reductase
MRLPVGRVVAESAHAPHFADRSVTTPLAVAVFGATGRIGRALAREISRTPDLRLAAALVRPGSPLIGTPAVPAGVAAPIRYASTLTPDDSPAVLIDFSTAEAFDAALALALERRLALVSGTTGLAPVQQAALDRAGARIPVLWSANFSLGVAALTHLASAAAEILAGWDCAITETHRRGKRDAPSGTALALAGAIRAQRREPTDTGDVDIVSLRVGDAPGEHAVLFGGDGEQLELRHRALRRDVFATGALVAARWLASKAPGRYRFDELLPSLRS